MRTLLTIALLLLASPAWAGPEMLLAIKTCTPPSTLHGSVTYSVAGTYVWPTVDMGTCAIPLTVTVKGSGGGGGDWFYDENGLAGTATAASATGWGMTALGGGGGDAIDPGAVAVPGSQSYTGAVTSLTQTTGGGNLGGNPDDVAKAAPGARGGYLQGSVVGYYSPVSQLSITVGEGGFGRSPATSGTAGSVKIEW